MNPLEIKVNNLETEIQNLKKIIESQERAVNEENIRNIVFFDIDNVTTTVQPVKVQNVNAANVDVPKNPTKYLRIYFRGQVLNVPVYSIS